MTPQRRSGMDLLFVLLGWVDRGEEGRRQTKSRPAVHTHQEDLYFGKWEADEMVCDWMSFSAANPTTHEAVTRMD